METRRLWIATGTCKAMRILPTCQSQLSAHDACRNLTMACCWRSGWGIGIRRYPLRDGVMQMMSGKFQQLSIGYVSTATRQHRMQCHDQRPKCVSNTQQLRWFLGNASVGLRPMLPNISWIPSETNQHFPPLHLFPKYPRCYFVSKHCPKLSD